MRAPKFWTARRPNFFARALQPAGWLYGEVALTRMTKPGRRIGAPVVCVGNFVAGGAGKTPAAIALARMLIAEGRRVAFLSRGYGGARRAEPVEVDLNAHDAAAVGDEPLLLARVAPCWVGPDRVRAARMAVEAGARTLIMDDGLQNPELAKDVALAVVDGETGFGNGLCLPAGPLRAPLAAQLRLVQAVVAVGGEDAAVDAIARQAPGKTLLRATLEPDAFAAAPLIGREVVAFAGIARPEKFYATLRRVGAQIVATRDFADHHVYKPREIDALREEATRRGALLATTEKDAARLSPREASAIVALPVTLHFEDPAAAKALMVRAIG